SIVPVPVSPALSCGTVGGSTTERNRGISNSVESEGPAAALPLGISMTESRGISVSAGSTAAGGSASTVSATAGAGAGAATIGAGATGVIGAAGAGAEVVDTGESSASSVVSSNPSGLNTSSR